MSRRTVHLVRHGRAGIRGTWPGSDDERPLDERGDAQADGLAQALAGRATSLRASPTERCRGTLRPLATAAGLPLEDAPELAEGVPVEDVLAWLAAQVDGTVCCTHGEVLESLFAALAEQGLGTADAPRPKGGRWELDLDADGPRSLTAFPATA